MTGCHRATWSLPLALALLALLLAVRLAQLSPPAPRGGDTPQAHFSAARAGKELTYLLGDETPHPVGSAANRALKQRLLARLGELGLQAQEQHTIGCSATRPVCARVENVLAAIPGRGPDTLLLMAHYDSVEFSPGAGDDGAAVATLLEAARAILPGAPYRNTILFAFTDAEEQGLLGAEAFFAEHPAARHVRAAINLEGSGSSGPVYLLRTGAASGELVRAFRRVANWPVAQSFTEEVFARMPNDTDFSVVLRAALPGIDFAFAGDRNHYHTPLDSIARLDPATLQHHGENTLPLLRVLADADLDSTAPNAVYASLGPGLWLYWPPGAGIALALGALVLLALASRRSGAGPLRILAASGIALLTLLLVAGLALGLLWAVDRVVGERPAWPADPWPWRLVLYAAPVLVLALLGPWAVRRCGAWAVLLGTWWAWGLLALAMALFLPLAAYLLVPAALAAGTAAMIGTIAARGSALAHAAVTVTALPVAAWFVLPLAHLMEVTQGLQLAPAAVAPLSLLALATLPAAAARSSRALTGLAAMAIGGALLLASATAPYSAERPQHLNVHFLQDVDAGEAQVVLRSPGALPQRITAAAPFRHARVRPWSEEQEAFTRAPVASAQAPMLTPLENNDPRWRGYRVTPATGSRETALCLPAARLGEHARIAGRPVKTAGARGESAHRCLRFVVPPVEGFDIELELQGELPQEAFLIAVGNSLPEPARGLAALRGALAVPVHSGDATIVYRRVRI